MVDSQSYYNHIAPDEKFLFESVKDDVLFGVSNCTCNVCLKFDKISDETTESQFNNYDWIYPTETKELTPHQLFLCDNYVMVHHMRSRSWGQYRDASQIPSNIWTLLILAFE